MLKNQSAQECDTALKAALHCLEDAKKCALLCFEEILERKLYRQLGYSTINQYAREELGFSPGRTGDFLALCRRLKKLPEVKAQIASGKLGYTKARTLLPVIDETNQRQWVAKALTSSRRELELEVKRARRIALDEAATQPQLITEVKSVLPVVMPVRVTLEMTPMQFSRYEALWEKIRKQRSASSDKVEALLEIMAAFADQTYSREYVSPPVQVHIHQCPDCEKATVQTAKGELAISSAEKERVACDCQTSLVDRPNVVIIRPALRRKILAKARHRCQRPGCLHTRYLEIHHIVPRSRGGGNEVENLVCLCSGCHGLVHERGLVQVKEPQVRYEWAGGLSEQRFDITPRFILNSDRPISSRQILND